MSAEIITLVPGRGYVRSLPAASRQVVPNFAAARPADLLEEREARSKAWHKLDAERRFFRARLEFVDAVFFAHRAKVNILMDACESASFPVEEGPYLEEHRRLVQALRQITEEQIRLPAAVSQHVNWKRPFALGSGWPRVTLARSLIEEYIEADEAFLKACPRKPRSRTGMHGGDQ
jgi:hypothetical protein